MEAHIFSIITALISGIITYLVARSGNKKDIEVLKKQKTGGKNEGIN